MSSNTKPVSKTTAYPAGLGRRLGAMLYDALLMLGIWMLTLFVLIAAGDGEPITGIWVQLLLLVELLLFYLFCWRRGGQTLGMAAWRIHLTQLDGSSCSWRQIGLRLLCAPLSLLCLGLGYIWLYFDADKQTWHDKISQTLIVHIPKD